MAARVRIGAAAATALLLLSLLYLIASVYATGHSPALDRAAKVERHTLGTNALEHARFKVGEKIGHKSHEAAVKVCVY